METLEFILLQALGIAVFLGFYRRSGEHMLNRLILLGLVLLPLWPYLEWNWPAPATLSSWTLSDVALSKVTTSILEESGFNWNWLWILYAVPVVLLLISRIGQMLVLSKQLKQGRTSWVNGFRIVHSPAFTEPFTLGRTVCLPPDLGENEAGILAHELVHVRQSHFVDLWLTELLCIVFWFNPLMWLIRKQIHLNLEYLSDAACARQFEVDTYAQTLYAYVQSKHTALWVNSYSRFDQLKMRISMLYSTSKIKKKAYLVWVPVFAFTLGIGSCQEQDAISQGETIENTEAVVQPSYPGGMEALIQFISEHVKYPESLKAKNREGRVMVGFTIDAEGMVKNVNVKNPDQVDAEFQAEAIRVVNAMPKWSAAQNSDGKAVAAEMVLPIVFKL
ncbi:MAG: M56 family peptidase [Bacteroidetes bacterium]|nr:MAG: M56 family peptidase [Bacteroidota bacterium]